MFNLLIVDDSINELKYIQKHIIHYIELKGYAIIVGTFLNEGTITIDVNKYDAIFLDIDMPKINGFDLATIINENNIKTKIIFITNMDQLVYEAVHQSPFDFIRKSNFISEYRKVIDRLYHVLRKENMSYRMRSGNKLINIKYSEILYFEIIKNMLYCHSQQYTYHETKTLKALYKELNDNRFLKINKSIIVNMDHIKSWDKKEVLLENNDILPINIRKSKELYLQYVKYIGSRK